MFLKSDISRRKDLKAKAMCGDIVWNVTPSTVSTNATSEEWTRDVVVSLQPSDGDIHNWFTKDITSGVSIADTSSAGTASIDSTTLSIVDGVATITISGNEQDWLGGTSQVETATVVGTIASDGEGNASVVVTSAAIENQTLSVAVANDDTASDVAGKIRTVLNANEVISGYFTVGGENAIITLTVIDPVANDSTLNIAIDNDTCSGLTTAATSTNTTAGVAKETDTLTITEATIMGYTVSAVTSVETFS